MPDRKIEEKFKYYLAPNHNNFHSSTQMDYQEANENGVLNHELSSMSLTDKAKKNWINIANLVLKNDKNELRRCLKMMKYGLFKNYKYHLMPL